MRSLIEARLAGRPPPVDPRAELLESVHGPIPDKLLEMLDRPARPAAVLLGLAERRSGLHIIFTERATSLKEHPGQVSFPGGRIERDDPSPMAAALREAEEEIGLKAEKVAVAGCLDPYLTVTGFLITPVVGFVGKNFIARPDPVEVIEVFEIPLERVLKGQNIEKGYRTRSDFDVTFQVYELSFEGHYIWGATAAILLKFLDLISNEKTNI